jgi:hypothetical protein
MAGIEFVADLTNRGVMNNSGENLGSIKALAINMESGRIAYVVLAFGSFPNRVKLFAVPWELLTFSLHDRKFILEVPKKILENGLGFDTLDQVAAGASFIWLGDVYEFYSDKPDWERKRQVQIEKDVLAAQARREEILNPPK